MFVKIAPNRDGFYRAISVHTAPVDVANPEALIRGRVGIGAKCGTELRTFCDTLDISYGIERYFVPEGEGRTLENARNQRKLTIVAAVAPTGRAASMRDFFTGRNLEPHAGRPNILRTLFIIKTGSFARQRWDIQIRDDDDTPLWLVHPNRRVDIAVLPLPPKAPEVTIGLYPLNVLANTKLRVEIGMEVFILGYPFKIELPAYPVWKRGSIASEPQLIGLTTPYMLVDTASRPGMSGAPSSAQAGQIIWSSQVLLLW